jgi:methylase of polypeptide subunit release factors
MLNETMTINTHIFPFELDIVPNIFKPNTTTEVFIAQLGQLHGKTVLDLGCGAGPISIAAALAGADLVFAGDIMHLACEATQANVRKNGVEGRVFVKQGYLFEPFGPMEFDLIVCDVSGIADAVARISPWYPISIPTGGPDGTDLTIGVLRESKKHLKPHGSLLFPVISLSNSTRIIAAAKEEYGDKIYEVASKMIPFSKELYEHIELLQQLKQRQLIDFIQRGSRFLWNLSIYRASK